MASKMILRSSGSSVRTIINRHLLTTAAATTIKSEPNPVNVSIYNWHYIVPSSFVQQQVDAGRGLGREFVGFSALEEVAGGRWKVEAAKSKVVEEGIDDEYDEEDDDEMEFPVDDDDDDDDDYGSGDDDRDLGTDDD